MPEWSAAYPSDGLKPDALRVLFGRALADPAPCQQYVAATRAAWLGERRLLVELSGLFPEMRVRNPASLVSSLRDAAEGLDAIAAGLPKHSMTAKNYRQVAREVRANAAQVERKAQPG